MIKTLGYAAKSARSALECYTFDRPEPAANEVQIDIHYCGVCHSDVHQARNEWKNTVYPCMPGHEIIGRVAKCGAAVRRFKAGDLVGVGCMVDSCRACKACNEGLEQYCENGFLATYNGNQRNPTKETLTFGGYSRTIVVHEDFVLKIPDGLDPAAAAPLLCAGVTTYSPLRHWGIGPGHKVGIVGMGGLGHVAIKLALAMGADVTLITTNAEKGNAARKLGVTDVVISTDEKQMKAHELSLDFILSTIPEDHDANPYVALLKRDGVLTIVGCLMPLSKPLDMSKMVIDRKSVGTSLIGGIKETQEMLDFCREHRIAADIELILIDDVNAAFDKIDKGEISHRYVIDLTRLPETAGQDAEHLTENRR